MVNIKKVQNNVLKHDKKARKVLSLAAALANVILTM